MPAAAPPRPLLVRVLGSWVSEVSAATLRADLAAAPLPALLALPQGIAFAVLAGLPPAWGLYAAILPAIVAALAGSSWHMVSGPTNAVAVALAASLAPLALAGTPEYLVLALGVTLLVGLAQLAVALVRLGTLAHFISPAVLLGFTSGAALLIAWHALRSWLALPRGWPLAAVTAGEGTAAVAGAPLGLALPLLPPWAPGEWLVGAVALAVAVALRRHPRLGGGWAMLLGLGAGAVAAEGWRLAMPGVPLSAVGTLPSVWPPLALPPLALADVPRLAAIALALTLIALGQTVAVAKVLAQRSGQALDANRECLGQGLANLTAACSSGFVVCGSFNRSLPMQLAGSRTPLASVFAALMLLAGVALAAPLLARLPLAAVHALLLVVAWQLVDRAGWRELLRLDRREAGVAAGTLGAMLLLPIEVAVLAGVAASLLVYLYRSARPALRTIGFDHPPHDAARRTVELPPGAPECPQLKLLRMEGNVFFGAVPHVQAALQALRSADDSPRHLLVMAKSMNFIDSAGASLWDDERRAREALGGGLYFHRPRPEVVALWRASGFVDRLGEDHLFPDKRSAIAAIVPRLDGAVCARCTARVFEECARQPGGGGGGSIERA